MRNFLAVSAGIGLLCVLPAAASAQKTTVQINAHSIALNCDDVSSGLCTDTYLHKSYDGKYVGHDEPSLLFYSDTPGAGNSSIYRLTLPKDSPVLPTQDGKGGTWNFQLHPAFWLGMAICDSQSFPEFTKKCEPNTDENIFDDADPDSQRFIGKHPGTAFLEMQFYPPGWIGSPQLIDPQNYFAAMVIWSFSQSGATGLFNNKACLDELGSAETPNFAVITKNGVPLQPANPAGALFGQSNFDLNNVLSMAPGDTLLVVIHDTEDGLEVSIRDLTSGDSGHMTATHKNGFGQVLYQPHAKSCNIAPYDFHPMYSTSSEHTRVPWAAHSYNIAFSDEIGHFEYCNGADPNTLSCTVPGVNDPSGLDSDDVACFTPDQSFFPPPPFQQIGGCLTSELDFDGVPYGLNWPGTSTDPQKDASLHSDPIRFTSPVFQNDEGTLHNYDRVGFETNVNVFEANCDFLVTGNGCVVPPPGVPFYPFYTIGGANNSSGCEWQEGGALIPGTTNTFGGSATTEYGAPLFLLFQTGRHSSGFFVNDNRQILDHNPCTQDLHGSSGGSVPELMNRGN